MIITNSYNTLTTSLQAIYSKREAENIANIVFEHYTGLNNIQRIIKANDELTRTQIQNIEQALVQLLQHKPVQLFLGFAWFYNNKFLVNEHVLIPRPETEQLVDVIIEENKNKHLNILDIGTGSGCIGISLKTNLINSHVTAIDVSIETLKLAQQNSKILNCNINFLQSNFLDENTWSNLKTYDVIVSNPPYISFEEKLQMQKNVLDFEPHLALFTPNDDVLIFYKKIATFALQHLNKNGKIYCEINEHFGAATADIFSNIGFETFIIKDFQEKDRMIKAWKK